MNAQNGLNLRQIPSETSKSLQVLAFGQRVVVIDDDPDLNGWYRVEGGGYVDGKHTQKTDPFDEMELLGEWRVTAYAETFEYSPFEPTEGDAGYVSVVKYKAACWTHIDKPYEDYYFILEHTEEDPNEQT